MWRSVLLGCLTAALTALPLDSQAHPRRWRQSGVSVGVVVGDPWYWGRGFYDPYFGPWGDPFCCDPFWSYRAPWIGPQRTTVIVRPEPQPAFPPAPGERLGAPPPVLWYFCEDPEGYYPHVARCPSGWLEVAAGPAAPAEGEDPQ